MARIALALALAWSVALAPQSQDEAELAQKIRSLILQLKDRSLHLKKKAEEDLFLMGAPALPVLRVEESRMGPGELKRKVGIIIKRIERVQQKAIASGATLVVTLEAKDQLITEVLAELQKRTSVSIEHKGIPADAVTSLDLKGVSLWEAVDQICSTNGKLSWDVSEKGIFIRRETYVRPFMATVSGYLLLIRPFLRFPPAPGTGDRDYVRGDAYVAGPPGAVPVAHFMSYEALADDKGTNLLASPAGLQPKPMIGEYRFMAAPDMTHPVYKPVFEFLDASPNRAATKVKTCKGTVTFQAMLEVDRRLDIRGVNLKKGAKESGFGVTVEVETLETTGGRLRMELAITDTRLPERRQNRITYPQNRGKIILRDAAGQEIPADVDQIGKSVPGPSKPDELPRDETTRFKVTAALKDAKLDMIEFWECTAFEETKIPFDFKDVPIKRTK